MDTTIVIEAWTSVITPAGLLGGLFLQAIIVGLAIVIGHEMGKGK